MSAEVPARRRMKVTHWKSRENPSDDFVEVIEGLTNGTAMSRMRLSLDEARQLLDQLSAALKAPESGR